MSYHTVATRLCRCILRWMPVVLITVVCACANIGNPSGGPRDEDPPRLIRADPPMGAVNVDKTSMTLYFNEIVNVKDAFSKIVLSPSGRAPRVTSLGRRVNIRFDSLSPNTTYTIDFADAIEDNNESNPLQNFAYTFSTGPVLDTLRISGMVLGARDLEPRPGILVGVHSNQSDTAFSTIPLLRVAKTDDRGRFIVRGLAPGSYRVFALDDRDADFKYSSDEEEMAFYDVVVEPSASRVEATDTLYTRLGEVDTVRTRMRTRYLPDDILLRSFTASRRPQYVSKFERNDSMRLFIKLATPEKSFPLIRLTGDSLPLPAIFESRPENDSITLWLAPSLVARDTLSVTVDYTRFERNKEPLAVIDTLKFIKRPVNKPKLKGKEKEKAERDDSIARTQFNFKTVTGFPQEVWQSLQLETPYPLMRLDTAGIRLYATRDTLWREVPKRPVITRPDTLQPRILDIDYNWEYGMKYRLVVDSLAAVDIYGRVSMPLKQDFQARDAGDYCSLQFNISGVEPGIPAFVELLDASDKPVRSTVVEEGRAFLPFLSPGKYYARLIEDYNGNGIYDSGNYEKLLQPDLAYYYPKQINIKKNWDKEENWDIFATAIDLQKPEAIKKNRPKSGKNSKKKTHEHDEDTEDEEFDPMANPFEK